MSRAVVLFSGGQDSTTCLCLARTLFDEVTAFSVNYGQRHRVEFEAAESICKLLGVPRVCVSAPVFQGWCQSALTSGGPIETSGKLPTSFVPGRNLVFLSLVGGYAAERGIRDVFAGFCETDYPGYPDCRRATVDAMQSALSLGLDATIRVHTPLMYLTKAETVRLARRLPMAWEALALSHTCYQGRPACGRCPACELRAKGFAEAGEEDPGCTAT